MVYDYVRAVMPPVGSNAGGSKVIYDDRLQVKAITEKICASFPELIMVNHGDNRVTLNRSKIFKKYKQQPILRS